MFTRVPPELKKFNDGEDRVNKALRSLFEGKNFYSIHSLTLANHPKKMEGEADFVLVTDFGIFCLEVKGGTVKRENGNWFYSGEWHGPRSPFDQASEATYPIIKWLERQNPERKRKFVVGWGVVFPDIKFDDEDPGWDAAQICDRRHFPNNFESFLQGLGKYWEATRRKAHRVTNTRIPDASDLKWAVRTIRPNIAHFSLLELEESRNELVLLEDRLGVYLDQLVSSHLFRSVISGIAGTGKTVLLREAVECIDDEASVMFLCFNATLAREFRSIFRHKENVTAVHYEQLKRDILTASDKETRRLSDDEFQDEVIEADTHAKLLHYDWLLIDEAQDFVNANNWEGLRCLIKGGQSKERYIVAFDGKAQSLMYDNFNASFFEELRNGSEFSLELRRNYRNPDNLARKAALLINEPINQIEVARTTISLPQLVIARPTNVELLSSLETKIKGIVSSGVSPEEITLLSFRRREDSVLNELKNLAGCRLWDLKRELSSEGPLFKGLNWSTVSSFKGLENHYILLIEGQKFNRTSDWWLSQLYVALTRAKTEFLYFGEETDACWEELSHVS